MLEAGLWACALPIASRSMTRWICLPRPPTSLDRDIHHPAGRRFCVTPSLKRTPQRYRNVCLFAITYAFRPRLRTRLTLSGLTFLRNPGVFGGRVSRPSYRYSFRHNLLPAVQPSSRTTFTPLAMLPYQTPPEGGEFAASATRLVPGIIGAGPLD